MSIARIKHGYMYAIRFIIGSQMLTNFCIAIFDADSNIGMVLRSQNLISASLPLIIGLSGLMLTVDSLASVLSIAKSKIRFIRICGWFSRHRVPFLIPGIAANIGIAALSAWPNSYNPASAILYLQMSGAAFILAALESSYRQNKQNVTEKLIERAEYAGQSQNHH